MQLTKKKTPPVWIIISMVVLPNLTESIYSPVLPDMATYFNITEGLSENTLTFYLIGYAIGMLIWGSLSDSIGRRTSLLLGLGIFCLSSMGCYASESIYSLLLFRIFQAIGGSSGSVIGYTISRDAFDIKQRSMVFSLIGSSLAVAPALGPVVGGFMDQYLGWKSIFPLIVMLSVIMLISVFFLVNETKPENTPPRIPILHGFKTLYLNTRTLSCATLTGLSISIGFCFFQESPFYFKHVLNLSPSVHGMIFIFVALSWFMGGQISHFLVKNNHHQITIMRYGCSSAFFGGLLLLACLSLGLLTYHNVIISCGSLMICIFIIMTSLGLVIPNSIALGLEPYQQIAGTASSVYGFTYYSVCCLVTLFLSFIHNQTVYPLPLYFFSICLSIYIIFSQLTKHDNACAA